LNFHTPLEGAYGDKLMKNSFISTGISVMIPGQEMRTALDVYRRYVESNMPLTYDVTVSYHGELERYNRSDEQTLDLSVFKGIMYVQ